MQVVECVNADALVVKTADGVQKKIHFSSLRPPRYCAKRSELAPLQAGGGGGVTPKKLGGTCAQLPKMAKIDTL